MGKFGWILLIIVGCGKYAPELKTTHRIETEVKLTTEIKINAVCGEAPEEDQLECIQAITRANDFIKQSNKLKGDNQ